MLAIRCKSIEKSRISARFPYEEYGKFDLEDMEDDECKAEFRSHKEDIPVLAEVLGLPETFTCSQGSVTNGIEGLCIMLKRFSYPCRYSDLIPRFGHAVPVMSMICNTVVDFVYNLHGHRITEYNHNLLDRLAFKSMQMQFLQNVPPWIIVLVLWMARSGPFVALGKCKELYTMDTNVYMD